VAAVVLVAVLALSLWRRLAMLRGLSYDYDEGVYCQSLESMRSGHRLFAEVFSSQPPLFLAGLSPIYNLLGGGIVAGRWPVLVGSWASLAAIFLIGRGLAGRWTGLLAMSLVASDPLYLGLSDRLQADLPSVIVGLAAVAVAVAAHTRGKAPSAALWLVAGGILGLSVMTKLLGVVFLVPVLWLAISTAGSRWRHLGSAAAGLLLAVLIVLAPFGGDLSAVYRQSIGLHIGTRMSEPQSLAEKLHRIVDSYPAVVPALMAVVACVAAAARRTGWVSMLVLWLAAAVAIDLAQGPLFIHHLVVLVPPLSLLAGAAPGLAIKAISSHQAAVGTRPAAPLIAVACTVLAAALGLFALASPLPPTDPTTAPAISAMRAWVPAGRPVVTDEPFAAAYTGHPVPPSLVDTSHARITTGELTTAQVEAATEAAGASAVVFSTGRLKTLSGFPEWVAHNFHLVDDAGGGLQVWLRDHN
jgi:4-amino-4-deoxy-L-arabinose transferase-like glycosyltransferase